MIGLINGVNRKNRIVFTSGRGGGLAREMKIKQRDNE